MRHHMVLPQTADIEQHKLRKMIKDMTIGFFFTLSFFLSLCICLQFHRCGPALNCVPHTNVLGRLDDVDSRSVHMFTIYNHSCAMHDLAGTNSEGERSNLASSKHVCAL